MNSPTVSVIIPTYNGAAHLGEAIQSVLDQTYPQFELIVVNDGSPDHTSAIVRKFNDPRLKYILFEEKWGADAARNAGIRASSGEIIAFLDQDDIFHPDKLQTHIAFRKKHPSIDFTYNARFEFNHSAKTIRGIWQPPQVVTLADLVLGFPMSPSDMVISRDWMFQVGLWDESHDFHGGEIILAGQLYLGGCKFGNVGRALNYRRYHTRRTFSNLEDCCVSELAAQQKILSDSRCPAEVVALQDLAYKNIYLMWAFCAFAQAETNVAQEFIREAVRLSPSILEGTPCILVDYITESSIADEHVNHEVLLQSILSHLPPEMAWLSEQLDWAVAHGYLVKGARAVVWDRPEDGRVYFGRAAELGAEIDEIFLQDLTYELLSYESEFGVKAAQEVLRNLALHLKQVGNRGSFRRLNGCYLINRAFRSYRAGQHAEVLGRVIRAIANDPKYLTNRGVLSVIFRSALGVRPS